MSEGRSAFEACIEENNIAFDPDLLTRWLETYDEGITDEMLEKILANLESDNNEKLPVIDPELSKAFDNESRRYTKELFSKCGDIE